MNGHAVSQAEKIDGNPYGRLRTMITSLLEAANPEKSFLSILSSSCFTIRSSASRRRDASLLCRAGRRSTSLMPFTRISVMKRSPAYINGRHVPIDTHLRNGDEVVIETQKGHVRPAA